VLQSWPKEMTDKLDGGNTALPSPDIDLDSREYGKALCSLLDIPFGENEGLLDSIHIMMMAYSALTEYPKGAEEGLGCGSSLPKLRTVEVETKSAARSQLS
ncbi:hypothetical protein THAOC_33695, partial [Thalassiosira oceanica]